MPWKTDINTVADTEEWKKPVRHIQKELQNLHTRLNKTAYLTTSVTIDEWVLSDLFLLEINDPYINRLVQLVQSTI